MFTNLLHKKRKDRTFKRWSREEEKMVVDYILEHSPFEKPSSRVYYSQLIEDKKMNVTWKVVRGKVRHIKDNFEKFFVSYQNKHLIPEHERCNFTKERRDRICPFYHQILQLYTENENDQNSNLYKKLTKLKQNTTDTFLKSEKTKYITYMSRDEAASQSKSSTPTCTPSQSPTPIDNHLAPDYKSPKSARSSSPPLLHPKEEEEEEEDDNDDDNGDDDDEDKEEGNGAEELVEDDPLSIQHYLPVKRKIKKWSKNDVQQVVSFLQDHPDFECPTARHYYTQLLNDKYIDATWDLVRWKVRHLRLRLKHARNYLKKYNNNLSQTDEHGIPHELNLEKICPFFQELSQIFKDDINEGEEEYSNSSIKVAMKEFPTNQAFMNNEPIEASNASDLSDDTTESHSLEMRKYDIEKHKLQLREYKLQQRHEIKLRKLEIEEKRMEYEMELKKRKLEVEETLGKYELDLKYKKNNNNNSFRI